MSDELFDAEIAALQELLARTRAYASGEADPPPDFEAQVDEILAITERIEDLERAKHARMHGTLN